MTTDCIKEELKEIDRVDQLGCFVASKKYEPVRFCKHSPCLSASSCILEIVVGLGGKNKFFVASNNPQLKEELRKVAGIPIIFNHHGQVMLEDPTKLSKQIVREKNEKKLNVDEKEQKVLQKLIPLPPQSSVPLKKKRKAKQPNPLSCKKKKKK